MALDLNNFITQPDDSRGLYQVADTMEKRRLRDQELANQKAQRKNANSKAVTDWLDPKNFVSGTEYDNITTQQINELLGEANKAVINGEDLASIQGRIGQRVAQVSQNSIYAKMGSKKIDEQVAALKNTPGYDSDKTGLAAKHAFFYNDDGTPKTSLSNSDMSTDWVKTALDTDGLGLTNEEGMKKFVEGVKPNTYKSNIISYDDKGTMNKKDVNITAHEWMVPDVDANGAVVGMVPKHDVAVEKGSPLTHAFKDANGKETNAQIRFADEELYDNIMLKNPGLADRNKAEVLYHIKQGDYKDSKGNPITINSPEAKLLGRALFYDDLNMYSSHNIQDASIKDKPSSQELNIRMYNDPRFIQGKGKVAEATHIGKSTGKGVGNTNALETIGEIFNNNPDFINGNTVEKDGRNVIEVTGVFPKGGLVAGKGDVDKPKSIYYDPEKRSLIVDYMGGTPANPTTRTETIAENDVPKFMTKIATSNGVKDVREVRSLLDKFGYKDGSFSGIGDAPKIEQPKVANPVQDYLETGDADYLKNVTTSLGKIKKAGEASWYNYKGKYYIDFDNGKTKYFDTKKAMNDFLQRSSSNSTTNTSTKAILD